MCLLFLGLGLCFQDEAARTADLEKTVTGWIQRVSRGVEPSDSTEASSDTWQVSGRRITESLQDALDAGVSPEMVKKQIQRIVNATQVSPLVAFRIHLQCYPYLDPLPGFFLNTSKEQLVELFAETQVELWCREPHEVERMVWFVVWSTGPDRTTLGMRLGTYISWLDPNVVLPSFKVTTETGTRVIKRNGAGDWSRRRMFMFLACITGCSEAYAGKGPTQVLEGYKGWRIVAEGAADEFALAASGFSPSWTIRPLAKKEKRDIRPLSLLVIPATPFPDWGSLPAAISPKAFRDRN